MARVKICRPLWFAYFFFGFVGILNADPVTIGAWVATNLTWEAVATFAMRTLATVAINYAISSLAGKPSRQDFASSAQNRQQTVRSAIATRQIVYGEVLLSGPLVFAETVGPSNYWLHLIVVLCGHEVEAIDTVYFDDVAIPNSYIDSGSPTTGQVIAGKYSGFAYIWKHLGTADQAADDNLLSESAVWTAAHRLRGCAYLHIRLKFDQDTFARGIPNIKAVVRGKKVYDPRTGQTAYSTNWALCMRDYLTSQEGLQCQASVVPTLNLNFSDRPDEAKALVESLFSIGRAGSAATQWQLVTKYLNLVDADSYVSTPDTADNSVTGDIDVRVKVALADWAPAGSQEVIAAKFNTSGNQRAWVFHVSASGNLVMRWAEIGSSVAYTISSSVAAGITDETTKWVRVTVDVDNGAGGADVRFYTSDDGRAWTQLGTTQTTAAASSIADTTAAVTLGRTESGTGDLGGYSAPSGKYYAFELRDGIDGTLVSSFYADDGMPSDSSFASSATGETWTLQGAAGIVGAEIETAAANTLRIDYDPVTLACKGLLIEKARTNELLYSEDFTNAAWIKSDETVTANAAIAPDGTVSADLITAVTGSGSNTYQTRTVTAGQDQSAALFVKRGNADWFFMQISDFTAYGRGAWFNLATGAVGTVQGTGDVTANIEDVGAGWYRVEINVVPFPGTATTLYHTSYNSASDNSLTRVAGATRYQWGYQAESGAFASSYIPTTSAAATRNADDVDCTDMSSFFNAAEGTALVETSTRALPPTGDINRSFSFDDGTTSERMLYQTGSGGSTNFICITGAATVASLVGGTYTAGDSSIGVMSYNTDDFTCVMDANALTEDTAGGVPAVTQLHLGKQGSFYQNGHIKRFVYWAQQLSQDDQATLAAGSVEVEIGGDEIDDDAVIEAANICDEAVTLDVDGNTQLRYECNGVVDLGQKPIDIIRALASAACGAAVYTQGVWKIYAGAYRTPTLEIDESWLRAPITVQPRTPRRELYNLVRGTIADVDKLWQATDFPPVGNSTYQTEDGGDQLTHDIQLPFTTDSTAAQRLAKIVLEKSRQAIKVSLPCNMKAFQVPVFETVMVTIDALGWAQKVFLVVDWKFSPAGGIDLMLQEEASGVYDWNYGNATTVDLAPDTNLSSVDSCEAPGDITVAESQYATTTARGVAVKAVISWVASPDPFLYEYQVEYIGSAESVWHVLPRVSKDFTEATLYDVTPDTYQFRVKALNIIGVSSDYATSAPIAVLGLSAAPSTPVIKGLQTMGGLALLTIEQSTELDVLRGGRVLVRHDESVLSSSWENSFTIGEKDGYPGDSVVIALPLKAGAYLVKFEDQDGNTSASAAGIDTKQASILAYSPLSTLQEDSTFSGTNSDTVAASGVLMLDGVGLVDDIADVDSVVNWDAYGGIHTSGTYTFAAGFNFGSVSNVRLTGQIVGTLENIYDQIDDWSGNVDSRVDWDGTSAGGVGDAYLELRETDDDPTGSPTWSDWKRLDAHEINAWGVECRLQIYTGDPAYNLNITQLRVKSENI